MFFINKKYDNKFYNFRQKKEVFLDHCMRCAFILTEEERTPWKFTLLLYSFNVDIRISDTSIYMNIRQLDCNENLHVERPERDIFLRIILYWINDHRQITHSESTDIMCKAMTNKNLKNIIDFKLKLPRMVSINILSHDIA